MNNLDIRKYKKKKIERIDIILENLEIISVPVDYIKSIVIQDICSNFIYTNAPLFFYKCKFLYLIISDKFNTTIIDKIYGERNSFKRLTELRDITAIQIFFSNGDDEIVYVDWWELDDEENLNQLSNILSDGSLEISINDENNDDEKVEILTSLRSVEDDFEEGDV